LRVGRGWEWLSWLVYGGGCSRGRWHAVCRANAGDLALREVESEWGHTVEALDGFIGTGAGSGTGLAWRGVGRVGSGAGRALARSGHVEHAEVCFCPCSNAC
jgi:hypothetical protein